MRAVRLDRPLLLDGRLDEAIYQAVPPVGGFIQQLPREDAPATEPTEVWVFYDDANLYVVARCHNSEPEREVVTELCRDGPTMFSERQLHGRPRHVLRSAERVLLSNQSGGCCARAGAR